MSNIIWGLALAFLIAFPALAQDEAAPPPRFAFPVDCTLDEDCWILQYVDMDKAEGMARDFKCRSRSYDTHKGTDFALRSMAEMRAGVNVLAAADGTVLRLRDGESDNLKSRKQIETIMEANKNCGNGVLIDHGAALFTQYCHLKKGSIRVKPGDMVKKGDVIAQVGNSGASEIPHLHLSIYWEDAVIDPFTGLTNQEDCGRMKRSLWETQIPYTHASIYDGGFLDDVPDFDKIENGQTMPDEISSASDVFLFWAGFLGVEEGDNINLVVLNDKNQRVLHRNITQDKTRVRQYYTLGKKFETRLIPSGTYTGIAILQRNGFPKLERKFEILVR